MKKLLIVLAGGAVAVGLLTYLAESIFSPAAGPRTACRRRPAPRACHADNARPASGSARCAGARADDTNTTCASRAHAPRTDDPRAGADSACPASDAAGCARCPDAPRGPGNT